MNEHILEEEAIAEERVEELARLATAITMRPISALPTLKPAICIKPSTALREAIQHMNEHRVGCVLVEDGGKLVGVFTERDILVKVAEPGLNIAATRVADVMTRDPECLTLEDGIAYALNKMSIGGFRHIPLVDEEHRPTGVVAMRNIVDYIVCLFPHEVLNLPPTPELSISREREGA